MLPNVFLLVMIFKPKLIKFYNPFVNMIMISKDVHLNKNNLLGKGLD
jgi:hypothetical protein